ncbi:hypothetical protein RCH10_004916 [Variovorax sp. GrIS 2.14]
MAISGSLDATPKATGTGNADADADADADAVNNAGSTVGAG